MAKMSISSSCLQEFRADQRQRWERGERVLVEKYMSVDPQLAGDDQAFLDFIYAEYCLRQELGDQFDQDEYFKRFPKYATQLRSLFDVHQAMLAPRATAATVQPGSAMSQSPGDVPAHNSGLSGAALAISGRAEAKSTQSRLSRTDSPAARAAAEPTIGQMGRFELKSVLGQGAFGRVYRAFDPLLVRMVALKVPRFGADEKTKVRRFHGEARAAAALRHPNIVAVFESGESDGQLFIATEFVHGRPLSAVLAEGRPSFRKAATWVRDLAAALGYAHQEGVVHRDIKPENIMLGGNELGGQERLQIMDFGLAKRVDEDSSIMTADGSVMGTPAYMSPEQARGENNEVGPLSDQYSLGVILYELLTGRRPFVGPPHSVIAQVISKEPATPESIDPNIPRDLAAICGKTMEKKPGRRYATLAETAADLDRWLAGEETIARPIGRLERSARWCRRNPVVSGLTTAAVLLAVVALAGWLRANVAIHGEAVQRFRAEDAFAQETKSRLAAEESQQTAIERLAESYFERGLDQNQMGNLGHGALWMVQALKTLPSSDRPIAHAIRANLAAWKGEMCTLERVLTHNAGIWAVEFAPDGRTFATGSGDGAVRLWDTATGALQGEPLVHPSKVWSMVFSPDGSRLFVAHENRFHDGKHGIVQGHVRVWDLKTRRVVGDPMVHPRLVQSIALSPDAKTLLTACNDDYARFWDVESRKVLGSPMREDGTAPGTVPIMSVAFSPDGSLAVIAGYVARLYRASDRTRVGQDMRQRYRIGCLAFSPDGKSLVTGSWDHTVRRWEVPSGRPISGLINTEGACNSVAVSADGRRIAMGGDRGHVQVLDTVSNSVGGQRLEHQDAVHGLAWSRDGQHLVAACAAAGAAVWAFPRRSTTNGLQGLPEKKSFIVYSLAVSADGQQIVTGGSEGEIDLWNFPKREHLRRFGKRDRIAIRRVEFQPRGTHLLSTHVESRGFFPRKPAYSVQFWDLKTGESYGNPVPEPGQVLAAFFSRDGKLVFTVRDNGALGVVDSQTAKPVGQPIMAGKRVVTAAISPDEKVFAAGYADGTVKFFDRLSGQALARPPIAHGASISSVVFSPDGRILLTAGEDNTVRFWDPVTGERDRRPALQHNGEVFQAAYSPDGRLIATVSNDKMARFWDAASGIAVGPPLNHKGAVYALAFDPGGRFLVTGGDHPDDAGRAWPVPRAMEADVSQVEAEIDTLVGLHMHDDHSITPLWPEQWRTLRAKLSRSPAEP
jgi:eukaryotic-like serine/threonine-protein kinase